MSATATAVLDPVEMADPNPNSMAAMHAAALILGGTMPPAMYQAIVKSTRIVTRNKHAEAFAKILGIPLI